MSILKYRGLMVLVLWQTVPLPLKVDSTGHVQLSLGVGAGQWEEVQTDCEGNVTSTRPHQFTGGGAQIDAWPTHGVRLTGFGGAIRSDTAGWNRWNGAYYGGLAALELQHFGVGGGGVVTPLADHWPLVYLRLGNRDVLHFRTEALPPSPPLAGTGTFRMGLGYGLGHLRRVGGQAGVAFCQAACDDDTNTASVYGELHVPWGSRFDLELRGLLGPGQKDPNTGIAIGGRIHLATPRPPAGGQAAGER